MRNNGSITKKNTFSSKIQLTQKYTQNHGSIIAQPERILLTRTIINVGVFKLLKVNVKRYEYYL